MQEVEFCESYGHECKQLEIEKELSYKAGMKKVTDFLEWENTAYQTQDGSPIIQVRMSEDAWQNFLKENGIDG